MAESHHHSEHHAPSFSPMQRRLYGLSKTIDYPCIDYQIAFKQCMREGNPGVFKGAWRLYWGGRLYCSHEAHDYDHCKLENYRRMASDRISEINKLNS